MEEINLKELFDYIKERALFIVAITLFIAAIGGLYSTFIKTPMYQSTSTVLLVGKEGTGTTTNTSTIQSDVQLNKSLVSTYSELVKSKTVVKTVIDNLSLNYSIDELTKRINVLNVNDTQIIKIQVVDPDPALSAAIANEVVKAFGEQVKKHYTLQNVSVVDPAEKASRPYNINFAKELIIYILVGLVLSVGVIFVIFYFDTTIKSAEDVEKKLELPILGIVPKVNKKEK